jgi:hypothetical protein
MIRGEIILPKIIQQNTGPLGHNLVGLNNGYDTVLGDYAN